MCTAAVYTNASLCESLCEWAHLPRTAAVYANASLTLTICDEDRAAPSEGVSVTLGIERFRGPEMLFQPYAPYGPKSDKHTGWAQHVFQAIMKCDSDLPSRKECYANILLAGGNTLWPGAAERRAARPSQPRPGAAPAPVRLMIPEERLR